MDEEDLVKDRLRSKQKEEEVAKRTKLDDKIITELTRAEKQRVENEKRKLSFRNKLEKSRRQCWKRIELSLLWLRNGSSLENISV
jgi:hypothetical protein